MIQLPEKAHEMEVSELKAWIRQQCDYHRDQLRECKRVLWDRIDYGTNA